MQFYCENITGSQTQITGEEAHHVIHVLRLRPGEELTLFDGQGTIAQASIIGISRQSVDVSIKSKTTIAPPATNRVIIAASIAKGERFDLLISKCTELGVDHIFPVIFEHTIKLAKGTLARQRFQKLALSAAKQSYRTFLPEIDEPSDFKTILTILKTKYPDAALLFGSTDPGSKSILNTVSLHGDIIAFIGPEGGFTAHEEEVLVKIGATGIKLTSTILRIETAAIALAGILCTARDSRL